MELRLDARKIARGITIRVDTTALEREMFGFMGWRKRLALALFRLGAKVLRVGVEVK
jgi:hypothetical protein